MPNKPTWYAANWSAPSWVVAGTTTRHGGVSQGVWASNNLGIRVGDRPEHVDANRQGLARQLGRELGLSGDRDDDLPPLSWLHQVHGSHCIQASDALGQSPEPEADAQWTQEPGLGLVIQSADCVPILLAAKHPDRPCIGAAHGGWRGLLGGVIPSLVDAMPVATGDLCAWIGPCISQGCFEVGEDVWGQVARAAPAVVAPHPADATKRLVNLAQLAEMQLRQCGVMDVAQSGLHSDDHADFYSHRQATVQGGAGAQTGRMASVVCLLP
jgi:YfiH family protein